MTLRRSMLPALACLLAGCGTEPVPRIAVEGTTIAIGLPERFDVGFGRVLAAELLDAQAIVDSSTLTGPLPDPQSMDYEDLQRGELLAVLVEYSGSTTTAVARLPLRYVAALNADPATEEVRSYPERSTRQNIVFLDIPFKDSLGNPLVSDSLGHRTLAIELRRFRRRNYDLNSSQFDLIPQSAVPSQLSTEWVGWAAAGGDDDPERGIAITIVDNPLLSESPTDEEIPANADYNSFVGYNGGMAGPDFVVASAAVVPGEAIPDPHFAILFDSASGTYGAAEIEVTYPAERIQITGVRPKLGFGWTSYAAPAPPAPTCAPTPRTLKLFAADSAGQISGVIVNFVIRDAVIGCGILEPVDVATEISVVPSTLRVFDIDGNVLAAPQFSVTDKGV